LIELLALLQHFLTLSQSLFGDLNGLLLAQNFQVSFRDAQRDTDARRVYIVFCGLDLGPRRGLI